MTPPCPRSWEAEALEDGRLDGADRDSFERHLATCVECRRKLASLASIRAAMASLADVSPGELELRRVRTAVLREANRRVLAPRVRRVAWIAALACAAAVCIFVWRAHSRTSGIATLIVAAPDYRVGGDGAAFTTRTAGPVVRIALTDGEASFAVAHLTAEQRFVVETPDAEIEVRGTRFRVLVEGNATKRVVVDDGRVALRRTGASESTLDAGESWSAPEPPPAVADASPPVVASPSRHVLDPGERFGRAMRSFDAGRYAEADAELAAFANVFPNDARAEDAAFLRAVARSRLGDAAGAAALARTYLRDYPNGLRRAEAQRLVDTAE